MRENDAVGSGRTSTPLQRIGWGPEQGKGKARDVKLMGGLGRRVVGEGKFRTERQYS